MIKSVISRWFGEPETEKLSEENQALRENQLRQIEYIRAKTNQLLLLLGTLPIRAEELSDDSLLQLDPIGVIAESFTQILEHEKRLHESLRIAHEETQAILASVGVGIIVLDSAMKIRIHNQAVLNMFGLEKEALSEKTCCQAVCGSEDYPPDCAFRSIIETRRPVHRPDWVRKGRHYEVTGIPVKNRFGEVTLVVLAYTDITKRIEIERNLLEKERMYLEVFENVDDMVQCVAPDGGFIFVNRAWREHLGYSNDEIAGLKIWNIIAPEQRAVCLEHFNNLMSGEKFSGIETVFFTRDCKELPVKGQVAISYSNGKPMATFGMFRVEKA